MEAELAAQFAAQGFCVVPGALSAAEVRRAREALVDEAPVESCSAPPVFARVHHFEGVILDLYLPTLERVDSAA